MRFVVGALLAAVSVSVAGGARAAPLDEPFVGGLGFTGPSSPSVASIYWNPAAMGAAPGTQVMISGVVRTASTSVTRANGTSAAGSELVQPANWPIGPGAFMGISSDLGGDRFTIGFATYMPYQQRVKYDLSAPPGTEPTRYQALEVDLRNLALVPALSIRFLDDLRLGIAPGFMFSTGRLVFDEDTALDGLRTNCGGAPCGTEDPAAAGRVAVDSGHGLGDAKFSLTLGGGIYYRRRGLEIGVAYTSRPIGGDVAGVEVAGERTTVTQPASAGMPLSCAASRCVFGDLQYRLPDVWMAGVTWHLRSGLELTAIARWLWFHVHDRIDVRLTGPGLEAANMPEHIVLYRGFRDVWDLRGRVAYWWHEKVRLGAQLRIETSAVAASAVNAAAIDGLKVQPMAMVQVRLARHFWLDAAYGVTLMSDVNTGKSAFDPGLATSCNASGGDLGACAGRRAGLARPSATGTYGRLTQDFGLTLTAKF